MREVTHARNAPKGVAQYLALTMLRTQRDSSMAPMMTPLLTRRGSCRVLSDDFIPPSVVLLLLPLAATAAGPDLRGGCAAPRPKQPPLLPRRRRPREGKGGEETGERARWQGG